MALPPLTPEQRSAALEKAAAARRERAAVKNRLKNAQGSLADVIRDGQHDDVTHESPALPSRRVVPFDQLKRIHSAKLADNSIKRA